VSSPFNPGLLQQAVRVAVYLYYPDGSSVVAEGAELRVDADVDWGDRLRVDVQVPETELRPVRDMSLRIYLQSIPGRAPLLVTRRPPVPPLKEPG
jgi:hypothetical protein